MTEPKKPWELSKKDYQEEVELIAKDAITAVKNGTADEIQDYIHETVDGHEWVIYYGYPAALMPHVSNPSALIDEIGADALVGLESWEDICCKIFAFAFMQDVFVKASDIMNELMN